jgi:hypothetical protein
MAKFNITVELDWLSEEGELDQIVKSEIINTIADKFNESLKREILQAAEEKISTQISNAVDIKVNQVTEELLSRSFEVKNTWGEVTKSNVSVMDLLKERLDNFLVEKVDKDGRTNAYNANQRRIDYVIAQNIDYSLKAKVDAAAKEIKKGLEQYIDTTLKAQIGENVAQLIGINKIKKGFTKED